MLCFRWPALVGAMTLFAGPVTPARAEATRDVVLTILHTNDMHGHVLSSDDMDADGPGGLARIATMVRNVRAEMPNVLFLDAGDIIHSTPTEYATQGQSMIAAMNAAGYDAATLGNHEFDWGQDAAEAAIAHARFPMLSANVRDRRSGAPYGGAKEYVILKRGPVRVAVFGLTTLQTVDIEWPPAISHVRFEDPIEAARRLVPELRRKADLVVFLSHLGYTMDRQVAKEVPGIDVIIGGHSHTTLPSHVRVGDTLIAQTGSYARNLGRMDLLLRRDASAWRIASVNGQAGAWWADAPNPPLGKTYPKDVLLPVTEDIPYDPAVAGPYRKVFETVAALLDAPLAEAPEAIDGRDSEKTPRPLPPTMAEMLRRALRADVAMVAGDTGPQIPAGKLTGRTVYRLIGGYTRQNVVVVRATGAAIRAAVEQAYRKPGAYPAYFAGLNGRVVRDGDVAHWEDAAVNGRPLDPARTYTLAAGAYPLMDYPSLMESPVVSDRVGWVKPLIARGMRESRTVRAYPFALDLPAPPEPASAKPAARP